MVAFTSEEMARIHAEGWDFHGGLIRRHFDARGAYPFDNIIAAIVHVRHMARTSELHARVFQTLLWTPAMNVVARFDGWQLNHTYTAIIPTPFWTPGAPRFETYDEATEFVKAQVDDPLAQLAIRTVIAKKLRG